MGAVNKDQLTSMSNDVSVKILQSITEVYLSSVVKNRYGIELKNPQNLLDSYKKQQQAAAKNLYSVEEAKVGKIRF